MVIGYAALYEDGLPPNTVWSSPVSIVGLDDRFAHVSQNLPISFAQMGQKIVSALDHRVSP